jgi:hypothetical protein
MLKIFKSAPPGAIALLIVLFFILDRLLSVGFLLPGFCNEDERWIRDGAVRMVREASIDPGTHKYPQLMITLTAGVYGAAYLGANASALFHFESWESFSWHRSHYSFDFVSTIIWGRMLAAVLGAAALLVFYRLARREFGEGTALIALLFTATAPAFLFSSNLLKSDMLVVLGVLLAVRSGIRILEKGENADYLLAGAAVGICLAAKHHAVAVVPVLFAHRLHHHELSVFKAFKKLKWLIPLGISLITFAILSPITWLDLQGAMEQGAIELAIQHANPLFLRSSRHWWHLPILFHFTAVLPLVLGIPLYLLSIAGIVWKLGLKSRRALVIWSYPAGLIAFMIALSRLGAPHLYTTIVPFMALAAALVAASRLGMESRKKRALAVALIGIVVGYNVLVFHGLISIEDRVVREPVKMMEETHRPGNKDLALVPYYHNPDLESPLTFAPQFLFSPELIEKTNPDRILVHHGFYNAFLNNPELMNDPWTGKMIFYYMELRMNKAGYIERDRWQPGGVNFSIYKALLPDLGGLKSSVFEKQGTGD